jgi:hypothetical protein
MLNVIERPSGDQSGVFQPGTGRDYLAQPAPVRVDHVDAFKLPFGDHIEGGPFAGANILPAVGPVKVAPEERPPPAWPRQPGSTRTGLGPIGCPSGSHVSTSAG